MLSGPAVSNCNGVRYRGISDLLAEPREASGEGEERAGGGEEHGRGVPHPGERHHQAEEQDLPVLRVSQPSPPMSGLCVGVLKCHQRKFKAKSP